MRKKERIPIILNLLQDNYVEFLEDCGLKKEIENDFESRFQLLIAKREEIEEFWNEYPDLRLTQVFVNLDIIQNFPGFWYYKEEVDYVVEKGWIKFEDINFWGVNYDKEGNLLPKTVYKLLSELEDDHILAILKFFEEKGGGRERIIPKYLEYFEKKEKRILQHKDVDDLLNNLNKEE